MNTVYCSCGKRNLYDGARPKFCASCGIPFDKSAASLVKVVVPQESTSSYGYCPACGAPGLTRERRLNGNDMCEKGHEYLSSKARSTPDRVTAAEIVEPEEEHINISFDKDSIRDVDSSQKMTIGSVREEGGAAFSRSNDEGSSLRQEAQKVLMQEVHAAPAPQASAPAKRPRSRKK